MKESPIRFVFFTKTADPSHTDSFGIAGSPSGPIRVVQSGNPLRPLIRFLASLSVSLIGLKILLSALRRFLKKF